MADYERYRYVASAPYANWGADGPSDAAGGLRQLSNPDAGLMAFGDGAGDGFLLGAAAGGGPQYHAGGWSTCSKTCGFGVKSRDVRCAVFQPITGTMLPLLDYECEGE